MCYRIGPKVSCFPDLCMHIAILCLIMERKQFCVQSLYAENTEYLFLNTKKNSFSYNGN